MTTSCILSHKMIFRAAKPSFKQKVASTINDHIGPLNNILNHTVHQLNDMRFPKFNIAQATSSLGLRGKDY